MRLFTSLLLVLLSMPTAAMAFSVHYADGDSGPIVRWYSANIPYVLHAGGSADILDGSDLQALRAGWKQWTDVPCSSLNFIDNGMFGSATDGPAQKAGVMGAGGGANGVNEVVWVETNQWTLGAYVLGITYTSFSLDGEIGEADIVFNGYLNKWSTNGAPGTVDVLNVAAHEQGHALGAQHVLSGYSLEDPPTMAPKADPNLKSASLSEDDKQAACFLNPVDEFNCTSDADCPYVVNTDAFGNESYVGKITCIQNLCGGVSAQLPVGTQNYGETCTSDYDCVEPYFCHDTGFYGVCAKDCSVAADCGPGFDCYPYSNAPGGVCLPESGGNAGAGKENGQPCQSPQECKSGMCVGSFGTTTYYCRQPCTLGAGECAAGESCVQLQGSSQGACFPSSGSSGTKLPGEICNSPAECITGLCVGSAGGGYKCREPCNPVLGDCPQGFSCQELVGGGGACYPADEKKGLGETCDYQTDCESDQCISVNGGSAYCTQSCVGAADCPCGMICSSFSSGEKACTIGGSQGCTPSGNPCASAEECVSQTCISGICRDPCVVTQGGCPPGQVCQRLKVGSINGVCLAQGTLGLGTPCSQDAECQSGLCELNVCEQPCDPVTSVCAGGLSCWQPPGTSITICAAAPATTGGTGSGEGTTTGTEPTTGGETTAATTGGGTSGTETAGSGSATTAGEGGTGPGPSAGVTDSSGGCSAGTTSEALAPSRGLWIISFLLLCAVWNRRRNFLPNLF